ncbi:MAG: BON domain-containing protein [Gemmata sp.]
MVTHLLTSKTLRTFAALACTASTGAVLAADPHLQRAAVVKPAAISDVTLARAVLTAFDADPSLRNVNILVSVVDRGAVIGGPVSSEAIRKRAEEVVRSVRGIESVKNTCFVDADPDPLLRAVAERMKPGATNPSGAALPGVSIPPGAADGYIPAVPALPPTDLVAAAPGKTVVAQHPNLLGAPVAGVLGAPTVPGAAAKVQPVAPIVPSTPGALTGGAGTRPADVLATVAAIRAADARFAKLGVEARPEGRFLVVGAAAKASDVWAFAAEVRKVPGVARVAVDPSLVK